MAPPLSGFVLAVFAAVAGAQDVFLPDTAPLDTAEAAPHGHSPELWSRFQTFMRDFKREYASKEERMQRFEAFVVNMVNIIAHNKGNSTYTQGINDFTDMTHEEFKAQRLGYKRPDKLFGEVLPMLSAEVRSGEAAPTSVDWTTQGAVTPVKDQGSCGGCWAFSATGALEGAAFVASGVLQSLSEQQLIDCTGRAEGEEGCQGGIMNGAFFYAQKNWLCSESEYPYTSKDAGSYFTRGVCQRQTSSYGLPKNCVEGTYCADPHCGQATEDQLMSMVAMGPVSVAIEADQHDYQFYNGGVMQGTCGTNLDHGVLAVGYGEDNGVPYWKIKNSWGRGWGEHGYIRIARGNDECGVLDQPMYPGISTNCSPNQKPNGFLQALQNPWVIGGIVVIVLLVAWGIWTYCRAKQAAAARGPPLVPAVSVYNDAERQGVSLPTATGAYTGQPQPIFAGQGNTLGGGS